MRNDAYYKTMYQYFFEFISDYFCSWIFLRGRFGLDEYKKQTEIVKS